VVLVYRDGRRRPVDCVYVGEHDGIHRWEILVDEQAASELYAVEADMLPAKTAIGFALRDDR
jgi:hypothetical protein